MFVQVIQGPVSDRAAVRERLDVWMSELAPGAEGWLGSTSGVTESDQLIVLARFDSQEAAQRNSDRSEQSEWWEQTATLFTDEPVFRNSTSVDVDTPGDPSRAGFVQVMQGRSSDPDRARELMADDTVDWQAWRPDILGSVSVAHEGGAWTMALYFTSEAEAREGEQKPPPPELAALMEEMDAITIGETAYFDLKDPWLHAPA